MTANACPSCARLQAKLDVARKERDEERNAHAELQARCYDYGGTGQNVFSDLANLRAVNEQYVNMDALKDSQLAALRTRLESAEKALDEIAELSGQRQHEHGDAGDSHCDERAQSLAWGAVATY